MIYKNKTEGSSPKDFRNYQNLIDLFKNLRDGSINSKKVLKNQNNFKSDLGEIKKEIKWKDQISVIQYIKTLFWFKRKKQ